jgi:hypothetical protein
MQTFANIAISTESDLIRLYCQSDRESPVSVHQNLLQGRAFDAGKIWDKPEEDRPITRPEHPVNYSQVGLRDHRALVLWSGWLYGRPMWCSADCEDADDDLEALTRIFNMCVGDHDGEGKDREATNACLDAIRMMLVHAFYPEDFLRNPLASLAGSVTADQLGRKMVMDLLVYGKCMTGGRTTKWLERWDTEGYGIGDVGFLACVAQEFAKAKAGGDAPDPMARCAYHDHPGAFDQFFCTPDVRMPSTAVCLPGTQNP